MSIQLFVDTNVFLSLYAFSDEDIEQFRNLFVLSQQGEIDFLLPQQVIDEFWRNREAKIKESYDKLKVIPNVRIPVLARDLESAEPVITAQKALMEAHKALSQELLERASLNQLSADLLIQEIFAKSTVIEVTEDILEAAEKRIAVGNPPGKKGSAGDAINWECILTKVEFWDNLHFVSRDSDYPSPLHQGEFNEFLKRELMQKHVTKVTFWSSLKAFMEVIFPKVKIEAFKINSEAVHALETSGSFATTHGAIAQLNGCEGFSTNQIKRLVTAAELNSQIGLIIYDEDVFGFYSGLLTDYGSTLPVDLIKRLKALVKTDLEF